MTAGLLGRLVTSHGAAHRVYSFNPPDRLLLQSASALCAPAPPQDTASWLSDDAVVADRRLLVGGARGGQGAQHIAAAVCARRSPCTQGKSTVLLRDGPGTSLAPVPTCASHQVLALLCCSRARSAHCDEPASCKATQKPEATKSAAPTAHLDTPPRGCCSRRHRYGMCVAPSLQPWLPHRASCPLLLLALLLRLPALQRRGRACRHGYCRPSPAQHSRH